MKDFSSYLIIIGGIVGTMGLKTPFVSCGVAEDPSLTISQFRGLETHRQAITTDACNEAQQVAFGTLEAPVMSSSIIPGLIVLLGLMSLSNKRKRYAGSALIVAILQVLFVVWIYWQAQLRGLTLSAGSMTAFCCGLLACFGGLLKYRDDT